MRPFNRRRFLCVLSASLVVAPFRTEAQPAVQVARIGHLMVGSQGVNDYLLQGLRGLGYVEGRNLVIEYRYADGKQARFPALAAELVALNVDVIVAPNTRAAVAAKQATSRLRKNGLMPTISSSR
jgi:putative ABC transport system substrate-binding protein